MPLALMQLTQVPTKDGEATINVTPTAITVMVGPVTTIRKTYDYPRKSGEHFMDWAERVAAVHAPIQPHGRYHLQILLYEALSLMA